VRATVRLVVRSEELELVGVDVEDDGPTRNGGFGHGHRPDGPFDGALDGFTPRQPHEALAQLAHQIRDGRPIDVHQILRRPSKTGVHHLLRVEPSGDQRAPDGRAGAQGDCAQLDYRLLQRSLDAAERD